MDVIMLSAHEYRDYIKSYADFYEAADEMPRIEVCGDTLKIKFIEGMVSFGSMPEIDYENVEVFLPQECILEEGIFHRMNRPKAIWWNGNNIVDLIYYVKGEYYWDDTYNARQWSVGAHLDGDCIYTYKPIDKYDKDMPFRREW